MNTIKISYKIEGLKAIDQNAPEAIESTIEYTLPNKEGLDAAGVGLQQALAAFFTHPGAEAFVKAMQNASVSVEATGLDKKTLPVGKQLKQVFRLAQAKLGV